MRVRSPQRRKGQGLVEYALLIAGVALISAAAVSLFGHKLASMIGAVAVILPGAHTADNGPLFVGQLIETTDAADGPIGLNTTAVQGNTGIDRLGNNVFGPTSPAAANGLGGLIVESQ